MPISHSGAGRVLLENRDECLITAFAFDGNMPLMMSIAGSAQIVQAVRAHFSLGKAFQADLNLDNRTIRFKADVPKKSYEVIEAVKLPRTNQQRYIIAHTALRGEIQEGDTLYIRGGDVAQVMPQVARYLTTPMYEPWYIDVWKAAQRLKVLEMVRHNGYPVWRVKLDENWQTIVTNGLKNGTLKPLKECLDVRQR